MAGSNEVFKIGSTLKCRTCFEEVVQGEVLAYDALINTVSLKTESPSKNSKSFDVVIINLNYSSDVHVVKEAENGTDIPLPSIDFTKINKRVQDSTEAKLQLMKVIPVGGLLGQQMYQHICKTMHPVKLIGAKIIVMDQIHVTHPYTLEDITDVKEPKETSQAYAHVRKIVEKFYMDLKSKPSAPTNDINSKSSVSNSDTAKNGSSASRSSPQVQPQTQ